MKSTEFTRLNWARNCWLPALVLVPLLAVSVPARAQNNNPIGSGGPLIFGAARNGKVDSVRAQLALNKELLAVRNDAGQTLLHVAAARRDAALVALLLEAGAEVNVRDKEGRTPLHLALPDGWRRTGENGPVEPILQLLMDKKADINARDNEGRTPLYLAVASSGDAAKILRAAGATDTLESWFVAVRNSDQAKLETLLATDTALLNVSDREGSTALHEAVRWRDAGLVAWLVGKGAPVDSLDAKNRTPLVLAITSRQAAMTEILLAKGANPNGAAPKTEAGANPVAAILPLVSALESGSSAIVTTLVARGADLSKSGYFSRLRTSALIGELALGEAANSGDLALVKTLLDKGVKPQMSGLLRRPLLSGDTEMVKLLIARGAPVNANLNEDPDENRQGAETPLHWAVSRRGNAPLVSLLLEKGAKWTGLDYQRRSPLNLAITIGDRDIVLALAAKNAFAEPPAVGQYPPVETPLETALRGFDRAMVLLLVQNGAKHPDALFNAILQKDVAGAKTLPLPEPPEQAPRQAPRQTTRTPLHLAAWLGPPQIVAALLDRGLDVNAKSDVTPLHLAVTSGSAPTVKLLLDKGADVNARNAAGRTPLHFAAMRAGADIVTLLLASKAERDAVSGKPSDGNDETPLLMATRYGNSAALKVLLEAGSDANATVRYGTTPLMLAAQSRDAAAIAVLLAGGANIEARDNRGYTVWHHAAQGLTLNFMDPAWGLAAPRPKFVADASGAFDALKAAKGSAETGPDAPSLTKTGEGGETAAALLADQDDVAGLTWLLDNGVAVNARDGKGDTLLHRAVAARSEEVVKLLLARKADVNALDGAGRSALDIAERRGEISADYVDFPFIPYSYSVPQNFNEFDDNARPPLLRPELARIATALRAAGGKAGGGPFLLAVERGAVAVGRDLLAQNPALAQTVLGRNNNSDVVNRDIGLDKNNNSSWPVSALQQAVEAGSPQLVKALIKAGALDGPIGNDDTTLMRAVTKSPEIVTLLLDGGAKINQTNNQGETALFMAVRRNSLEMVKLLLDKGTDVKITNKKGETALQILAISPLTQEIRALLEARNAQ